MEWVYGLVFIALVIAMPFIIIHCMTDGGTYQWSWSRPETKHRTSEQSTESDVVVPSKMIVDMAYAHHFGDTDTAVDLWKQFPNFTARDLIDLMGEARAQQQPWLGQAVDQKLWSDWSKFLKLTYAEAHEEPYTDFILSLEDRRDS